MAAENVLISTAFLLIIEACSVLGQARIEYINQPYPSPTVSSAPCIQAAPQLVVPAIIKPVIQPCDSYVQETAPCVPSFNNFGGYPGYYPSMPGPMPMPPIIVESDDDDDNWHHLLYFLIFAMRNRRNGGCGGCGCNSGCGGGCGCGCGGGCGGCNGCCCGGCNGCCCGCCCGNCGGNCGGFCGGNYGGCSGNCGGNCGGGCGGGCNCGCCNNGCYSCFPYPIAIPINGYGFGGCGTDTATTDDGTCCANGQNGINLYIRTDCS